MCCLRVFCAGVMVAGVFGDSYVDRCGIEASSHLIHHNPWLVFLEFYRRGVLMERRCGGTLIGSCYVITAAHCVNSKSLRLKVRLGEYDLTTKMDCERGVCADPPVKIDVEEVIIHPGYDHKEHDIALLKLAKDAPYTDFIRPACLPTGDIQDDVVFSAAGWGEIPDRGINSKIKKILPLPYWSTEKCKSAYSHASLPENIVCAGGEDGIDTCRGDSGGPLTWFKSKIELWGITSTGNVNCGTKGSPGIYTSVKNHLDWIKAVIES